MRHQLVEGREVMLGKSDHATFRRPCGDVAEQLGEGSMIDQTDGVAIDDLLQ